MSVQRGQAYAAVQAGLAMHRGPTVPRKWGGVVLGVDRAELVRQAEASRDRRLKEAGVEVGSLRFAGSLELPG